MKNPDLSRSAPKPVVVARKNLPQAANNKALATEALNTGVVLSLAYEGAAIEAEVHIVGQSKTFRPAMSAFVIGSEEFRVLYFDEAFDVALSATASQAPRAGHKAQGREFRKIDATV